jgi:prepilin-type N-terminal cleavage/methylation domain-containing protein
VQAAGSSRGFTLVELMIVVAVAVIIMAIAIPGLIRSRLASMEANAIAALRTINGAQSTFASSCGSGFYAPSLVLLGTPPIGEQEGFLGPDLAADPAFKTAYRFTLTAGVVATGAPASCNGAAAGTLVGTFYLAADPQLNPGQRHFGSNQGGTVYQAAAPLPVTQNGQPAGSTIVNP